MDDQPAESSVRSNPHWTGDPSKVRGPCSDGSFSIPARALHVTWGNDPRYWEWVKFCETESKVVGGFEEGAMLQQVNWLEVMGEFELHMIDGTGTMRWYKVYYVMKFNEDAFGWSHAPIKFKVKSCKEAIIINESQVMINLQQYGEKPGTWHKVYVGEIKVVGNGRSSVEVGMFEVETDWWKGSMILAGIRLELSSAQPN